MLAPPIATALVAGATIVTPNKRLARFVVARHDAAQRRAGRLVWPAASALPWPAWLGTLWLDALAAGAIAAPRPVVSPAQSAHLWDTIVAADTVGLLDRRGAAAHAADAWALFHEWRRPGEHVDGWARSGLADDAAAFARWADRYRFALDRHGLADAAALGDVLADAAPRVPSWRGRRVTLVGFADFTRQQRRLLAALAAAGLAIDEAPPAIEPTAAPCRVACATPTDETARALEWARDRALADPQASVGIAVVDLTSRRDEVLLQADDLLCAELAVAVAPDAARPYGVSLGSPLAELPIIAAALDLIALASTSLPMAMAAALLRSPYLPGADAGWRRRAGAEEAWRNEGARTISWNDATAALLQVDRDLGERWLAVARPARGECSPRQWVDRWRELLAAIGWPGDRTLGSGDWQACEAWSRLIVEFATLGAVSPAISRDDALAALTGLATRTMFQPERAPPRIQILGLLEAAGMTFDALWIAGLTAESWPPPPQPNPLLPLAWQRDRNVSLADADAGLARAQTLTTGFAGAAREVVASHARVADGFERAGSALVETWTERPPESFPTPAGRARAIRCAAPPLTACNDTRAPAIAPGTATGGGAGIVESQSACPFQAFARYRLAARAWAPTSEGLTSMERGILIHASLRELWNDLGDQHRLLALETAALDARIAAAVAAARNEVARARWHRLPPPVAAGEAQRLVRTIRAWLDRCERARPPFEVRHTEWRTPVTLGGLALTVQIDRVDSLGGGGVAIIDYKSGAIVEPANWFAPRPSGTQLPLYALAFSARERAIPVRALAYGRVKAGEIGVGGLAADAAAWPGLKQAAELPTASATSWRAVEQGFAATLGALADAFRTGQAPVAPRDAEACRRCDLKPLCRVRAIDDEARPPGDDND